MCCYINQLSQLEVSFPLSSVLCIHEHTFRGACVLKNMKCGTRSNSLTMTTHTMKSNPPIQREFKAECQQVYCNYNYGYFYFIIYCNNGCKGRRLHQYLQRGGGGIENKRTFSIFFYLPPRSLAIKGEKKLN